jgi:glycosyltransferase involved in cell wall biosynthesis
MAKVLLLTFHFPPSAASGAFRMLGLARHLPNFDWQTVVVAPPRMPWEPEDVKLAEALPEGTSVCPVPFPEGFVARVGRRLIKEAVWLPRAARHCARLIRAHRPDALFTSSPPHPIHLLGLWLKRRYHLPWVADFRDTWATDGRPRPHWSVPHAVALFNERKILQHADAVIANAPLAGEALAKAYPHHQGKIVTIPNGFDPGLFPPPSARDKTDTVHILYAGEVYWGRDPRPFLDAIGGRLGERFPLRVRFLGRETGGTFRLDNEIRRRGLDKVVRLAGQVTYQQTLQEMIDSDILLLLDTPGRCIGVPAKLYEYLGAGKPILALAEPDGDVSWALRKSGVPHRIAAPHDVGQITQALDELLAELRDGRAAVPTPEQLAHFTREQMARRVADCLNDCLLRSDLVGRMVLERTGVSVASQ